MRHFEAVIFRVVVPLLIFSPLVQLGSWLAVEVYNGAEDVEALIDMANKEAFTFLYWIPDFSFDLDVLRDLNKYANALIDFGSYDPNFLVEGSQAFMALNFLMSIIKLMFTQF